MRTCSAQGTRVVWLVGCLAVVLTGPAPVRGQCQPSWSPVGSGIEAEGAVRALVAFDDGTGPALYAGGAFETMDGIVVNCLAKWDGQDWSQVGGGVSGTLQGNEPRIDCLEVLDLGGGPALYVGGDFRFAGSVEVNGIARWDGVQWSMVGSGVQPNPHCSAIRVYDLCVYDDGTGPALYVAGIFSTAGGPLTEGFAKWDGSAWTAVGGGLSPDAWHDTPYVGALIVHDEGSGCALYVAGNFGAAGGLPVENVAKWDGASWWALGDGLIRAYGSGIVPAVVALAAFDPGAGRALFASGSFYNPQHPEFGGCFAQWDGSAWSRFANFLPYASHPWHFSVMDLREFDDGTGPALYASGLFEKVSPLGPRGPGEEFIANCIVKWDGKTFSPLAGGLGGHETWHGWAGTLNVFDDGLGEALYVGGCFRTADGLEVNGIARWGCLRGDLNCDVVVNSFDIDAFVLAISDPDAYGSAYPDCDVWRADMNIDGRVDAFDIDPFVELLTGG